MPSRMEGPSKASARNTESNGRTTENTPIGLQI